MTSPVLTYPYVNAAEFRAHPTFLDTDNLRTAYSQAAQDAALTNALLKASQWADDHIDMPLAAHVQVENARLKPDRFGQIRYHPEHAPVVSVSSMAIGTDPDSLATLVNPTVWIEQNGRILVAFLSGPTAGLNSLQFGRSVGLDVRMLVQWTTVAGFPISPLAAHAAAGATSLTVLNAIGVLPGSVLRVWTPTFEEAVTVSGITGTTLTLTAPLRNDHEAGDTLSGFPPTVRDAVINATIADLLRPAPAAEQNTPARAPATSTTAKDPVRRGGGAAYLEKACHLLKNYKRIR